MSQTNYYSAQTSINQDMNRELRNTGTWVYSKPLDKTAQGSEYLFKIWDSNNVIESKSGSIFSIQNLNYNLRTKTLESQINSDTVFKFDFDKIVSVTHFNKKYKVINNALFEQLSQGNKIVLYKEYVLKVQEGVVNPLTQTVTKQPQNIKIEKYYCLINESLKPIKLRKRDVLECIKDKENEIIKFVKENKLSFSKEENVIQIFNYYKRI